MVSPAMGARQAQPAMQPMVTGPEMSAAKWQQAAAASAASAALFLGAQSASAGPFTQSEIASLTSAREARLEFNSRAVHGKSRRVEK